VASGINAPLIPDAWLHNLRLHPHQDLVQYFMYSVTMGFRLGSKGITLQSAKKNLKSATNHPYVIDDYFEKELSLGRISGPYPPPSICPRVHINRFGVIPAKQVAPYHRPFPPLR